MSDPIDPHLTGPLGKPVHFNEADYQFWSQHFNEEAKAAMIKEDLTAGEFVSIELFAIVAFGVLLGIVGVLASFWS